MNTFRKIGSDWCVQLAEGSEQLAPGTEVTVTLRSGATKMVTLGEYVGLTYGHHVYKTATTRPPATPVATVGDISRILALFDRAQAHLRFPAIALHAGGTVIKLKRAGAGARVPGSLNVIDADRVALGRPVWYGRVHTDGRFEPSRATEAAMADAIVTTVREFATDPARVAGEHGRVHLHGHCCFCRKRLTDERSTLVGYGPDCASHFGLPWGDRPAEFASATPAPTRRPRRRRVRPFTMATYATPTPTGHTPPTSSAGPTPVTNPNAESRWDDTSAATRLEDSER